MHSSSFDLIHVENEGDVYVNTRGNEIHFVFICGCRQITCRPIYVINIDDGGWNFPLLLFGQQPDESYILCMARAPAPALSIYYYV